MEDTLVQTDIGPLVYMLWAGSPSLLYTRAYYDRKKRVEAMLSPEQYSDENYLDKIVVVSLAKLRSMRHTEVDYYLRFYGLDVILLGEDVSWGACFIGYKSGLNLCLQGGDDGGFDHRWIKGMSIVEKQLKEWVQSGVLK